MFTWRELYDAAKVETSPGFLTFLLDELEGAMWNRARELDRREPDLTGGIERVEMAEVADKVLILRTEKLGWPDPLHTH